mmetsp:Transcript_3826/g.10046  ORF Transcript_3826/g.10046 Transcript_3826/m.10046 type:complete len:325 (+) Transcript_3826:36-1010(+)
MNNITRRLASSGSLTVKKNKSVVVANGSLLSSANFLLSPEAGRRERYHDLISVNAKRNGVFVDGKSDKFDFSRSTSLLFFPSIRRCFSSKATPESSNTDVLDVRPKQKEQKQQILSPSSPTVITDSESGEKYGILLDSRKLPKLKPGVVRKRLDDCRIYEGREKSIRHSPWKLNRICQLAAGLTLEEALTQLKFCELKNADLVAKVLKRTSNLADIRDGLQMSQLEVKECFATKSLMLRRIKTMGRGRHGIMHHKFSHIRVVLREIDFPLRIYQQKSLNQKKNWLRHQQRAEYDARAATAKREELERLEKQEAQLQEQKAASKQ